MYLFTYSCGIILFFIRILIQGLLVAEGNKTYLNLPPPPQKKKQCLSQENQGNISNKLSNIRLFQHSCFRLLHKHCHFILFYDAHGS